MAVSHQWVRALESAAHSPVLTAPNSTSGAESSVTGPELLALSAQRATALACRGVGPGTPVVFACRPSLDAVLAFVALMRLGAVVVVANPDATNHERHACVDAMQSQLAVATPGQSWPIPVVAPESLADNDLEPLHLVTLDSAADDDLAVVTFTSGTTGNPKGVPLTHGNISAGIAAIAAAWEWQPNDVLVCALPLFHVHGLLVALTTSLAVGGHLVLLDRFSPQQVVAAVRRHSATMFFAVPTMWWRLDEANLVGELANLRMTTSGSAALDRQLFGRLTAALGSAPIERYGMSETLMLTTNPLRGERKAGSVGLPFPGVELRIDESGEVLVRGRSVISGYVQGESAESFAADGWFHTGDVGYLDGDGYLYLTARKSDVIITGGHNVAPRDVEDVIRQDPRVDDVAVIGVPDPEWGQRVAAVVVPSTASVALEDLEILCRAELANFRRPRVWKFVDSLPRTPLGKVQRSRIHIVDDEVVIQ